MHSHCAFEPMFLNLGTAIHGSEKQTNVLRDCFAINLDLVFLVFCYCCCRFFPPDVYPPMDIFVLFFV